MTVAPPADREGFVTVAGHRLHTRTLNDRASGFATLVFLHEGLGSIPQWGDFPERLCQATALPGLVYERWGFGRSDGLSEPRGEDYLHREAQEFLPGVLAACAVERPILVGHSDGATIALLYAAAYPEAPLAVVSEAAHVFVEEITLAGIRAAEHAYRYGDLQAKLARYHGDNTATMFWGWAETWQRPAFRHWRMVEALPAIRCPVLALQGEGDEYGTAKQVHTIAAQVSGPVQTWLVPNCGHSPHRQATEAVTAAIAAFIHHYRPEESP